MFKHPLTKALRSPRRSRRPESPKHRAHADALEPRLLLSAVSYTFTFLASFGGLENGENGATPYTIARDSAGNLVGTTATGGPLRTAGVSGGTVFKIPAGTTAITTALAFQPQQGFYGHGNIAMDSAGNLYAAIVNGGVNGRGSIVKIAAGLGSYTVLASFDGTNGQAPIGGVIIDSAGNLYGAASSGGPDDDGTLFEIPAGTGNIVTLATFNGDNGSSPIGTLLRDSAGNLYGTAQDGGNDDDGLVFELPAGGNAIVVLAQFNGDNGSHPTSNLVIDSLANLYGTASHGGSDDRGVVFKLAPNSGTIAPLVSFNETNGSNPLGTLLMDDAGTLLGVTSSGGNDNDGTVWLLRPGAPDVTSLISFNGDNGRFPSGALIVGPNGKITGTTIDGGADDVGAIFEMDVVSSAFVPNLYADIFGRAPDPAGVAFWNSQLAAGMAPQQAAAAFITSPEHRQTQITSYYNIILGRDPDASGLNYWMNFLATGGTVEQLQASLYGSQEYLDRQGSVNNAIAAMYFSILDRHPDAAGLAYWSNQVAAGMSLSQVAMNILVSPEKSMQRVEGVYEFYLLRNADPGGLAYWSAQLEAGTSIDAVIQMILGTPEYYATSADHAGPTTPV